MEEWNPYKLRKEGVNYYPTLSKDFYLSRDISNYLDNCADFAFRMTLGKEGEHRDSRSGGTEHRDKFTQFQHVFEGKMGEYAVWNYLTSKGFAINEPDLGVYGRGEYDKYDLLVNGKTLSIKTSSYKAQLLLLETKNYNKEGLYIPNIDKGFEKEDFFIFCRIRSDIKELLGNKVDGCIYDYESLLETLKQQKWERDLPGFITRDDFLFLMSNHYVIPQGIYLNGKRRMDAENYYCQAVDLHPISSICAMLHE